MKNFKFLFLTLIMAAFFAPSIVNAQVTKTEVLYIDGGRCNIQIDDEKFNLQDNNGSAFVKITPDGSVHLEATFDVDLFDLAMGKKKVEVTRAALLILEDEDEGIPYVHVQTYDAHVIVDLKTGVARLIVNWDVLVNC